MCFICVLIHSAITYLEIQCNFHFQFHQCCFIGCSAYDDRSEPYFTLLTLSNQQKLVSLPIRTFLVTRAISTAHFDHKNDVTVYFCSLVHCINEAAMLVVPQNY